MKVMLHPKSIVPTEWGLRKHPAGGNHGVFPRMAKDPKILALREKIRGGWFQPITVEHKDGQYHCIDGHHRLAAAQLEGLKEIPAIVKEY
jgi:ParB-like chromosome segregation protein Spo0J